MRQELRSLTSISVFRRPPKTRGFSFFRNGFFGFFFLSPLEGEKNHIIIQTVSAIRPAIKECRWPLVVW
jgi:hypothetical protein